MRTLALLSRKGGTGKTTLSVNLAVCAVQAGKRVLLIDTDPQRSAAEWWQTRAAEAPELVECPLADLPRVLEAARAERVDTAILDTQPGAGADITRAAMVADLALICTRPSIFDLRAIRETALAVTAAKARAVIVLNAVPPERIGTAAALTAEARGALEAYRPVQTCPVAITSRAAFVRSLTDGLGVTEFAPQSPAAAELRNLFTYLEGQSRWQRAKRS